MVRLTTVSWSPDLSLLMLRQEVQPNESKVSVVDTQSNKVIWRCDDVLGMRPMNVCAWHPDSAMFGIHTYEDVAQKRDMLAKLVTASGGTHISGASTIHRRCVANMCVLCSPLMGAWQSSVPFEPPHVLTPRSSMSSLASSLCTFHSVSPHP